MAYLRDEDLVNLRDRYLEPVNQGMIASTASTTST